MISADAFGRCMRRRWLRVSVVACALVATAALAALIAILGSRQAQAKMNLGMTRTMGTVLESVGNVEGGLRQITYRYQVGGKSCSGSGIVAEHPDRPLDTGSGIEILYDSADPTRSTVMPLRPTTLQFVVGIVVVGVLFLGGTLMIAWATVLYRRAMQLLASGEPCEAASVEYLSQWFGGVVHVRVFLPARPTDARDFYQLSRRSDIQHKVILRDSERIIVVPGCALAGSERDMLSPK